MITTTDSYLGIATTSEAKPLQVWAEEYTDKVKNSGRVGFIAFALCDDGFGRYYIATYHPFLDGVNADAIYPVY